MIIKRNNNFNFCKPFWRNYFINKSKLRISESIRNTFIRKKSLLIGFISIFMLMSFLKLLLSLLISLKSCFNSLISCLTILISCCKSLTVSSLDSFLLNFSKVLSSLLSVRTLVLITLQQEPLLPILILGESEESSIFNLFFKLPGFSLQSLLKCPDLPQIKHLSLLDLCLTYFLETFFFLAQKSLGLTKLFLYFLYFLWFYHVFYFFT